MSSSDVERLERALRTELSLTRDMSKKDHDSLREALVKLDAKVDGIASRLNDVEDRHAMDKAQAAGRSRVVSFATRVFTQFVTVIAAIVGAVAISEHWFK